MNEGIMRSVGFGKQVDRMKAGKCSWCGKKATALEKMNMDELTKKEFEISGLCEKCQKEIFGY